MKGVLLNHRPGWRLIDPDACVNLLWLESLWIKPFFDNKVTGAKMVFNKFRESFLVGNPSLIKQVDHTACTRLQQ